MIITLKNSPVTNEFSVTDRKHKGDNDESRSK